MFSVILLTSSLTSNSSALSQYDKIYEWGSFGIAKPGQFSYPQFIEVDGFGEIYVTDLGNKRVQKFSSNGDYLLEWGGSGRNQGEFHYPSGIASDEKFVYVADRDLNRIQKFDLLGNFVSEWGTKGKFPGQFLMPNGITTFNGTIYVADTGNHRVQKFTSDGEFVLSFGTSGIGPGQFLTVIGVDVDDAGNVYVTDKGNKKVEIFDSNGLFVKSLQFTANNYEFVPEGIILDSNGGFYVINAYNDKVLYLNEDSSLLLNIFEQSGPIESSFVMPTDLTIGKNGELHIVDSFNHQIQTFETPYYVEPPEIPEIEPIEIEKIINDDIPPELIPPEDLFVEATDMYTPVSFGEANATDDSGIKAILNNGPDKFSIGISKITWIAFDNAGNTAEGYQFITVYACGLPKSDYNVIQGTSGDDVLIGTAGKDLIFGMDGNDLIDGKSENDCIFGGNGNDVIFAGDGYDTIHGGNGDDVIKGQNGIDIIYGNDGSDILDGGEDLNRCYDSGDSDIFVNCE